MVSRRKLRLRKTLQRLDRPTIAEMGTSTRSQRQRHSPGQVNLAPTIWTRCFLTPSVAPFLSTPMMPMPYRPPERLIPCRTFPVRDESRRDGPALAPVQLLEASAKSRHASGPARAKEPRRAGESRLSREPQPQLDFANASPCHLTHRGPSQWQQGHCR